MKNKEQNLTFRSSLFFLCLLLCACKQSKENTPEDSTPDLAPTEQVQISYLKENPSPVVAYDSIPKPIYTDDIDLYEPNRSFDFKSIYFSLSTIYNNDSLDIPPQYIKEQKKMSQEALSYFPLEGKYRENIFERMKLTPKDTIFLYSYQENQLRKYPLADTRSVAAVNVYADIETISAWDYEIGFELQHAKDSILSPLSDVFFNSFVYIGKESPFSLESGIRQMQWKKVSPKEFPASYKLLDDNYLVGNTYKYVSAEVICYVQDFDFDSSKSEDTYYGSKRYFVAVDAKSKKIIKRAFFEEGESTSFAPLDNGQMSPFIGRFLKGKPLAIYGLVYESFGCNPIIFLDDAYENIYPRCDNRHWYNDNVHLFLYLCR